MAMFIEMELIHEGYEVDKAYDGREGLENTLDEIKVKDIVMNNITHEVWRER